MLNITAKEEINLADIISVPMYRVVVIMITDQTAKNQGILVADFESHFKQCADVSCNLSYARVPVAGNGYL